MAQLLKYIYYELRSNNLYFEGGGGGGGGGGEAAFSASTICK